MAVLMALLVVAGVQLDLPANHSVLRTDAVSEVTDETIRFLTVRPDDRNDGDGWIGDSPEWFGEYLFGGFVMAQAVHAATRNAPEGRRIHSLHAYFLRPVRTGLPVSYRSTPLREG